MLVSRTKQLGFRPSTLALALAGVISAPALADAGNIEKIEVWSTAVKTSALYLKEQEIADKQADHISDLLRAIPGIDVGGAHSLNQRITIRSMDDKDLKISIDGAAQNTYMYHHMGNLQIHADILKSVDIETGTNSVINGGLGGAVRFETKQARELLSGDERFAMRVSAGAADNAGHNYSVTGFGLLTDDVDFLAYYNHVERDNYEVGGGKILDQDDKVVVGTDGEVKGLEGEVSDALVKLGWNIDNNQRIALSYETYKDEGDYSYRPDMGLATDMAITNSLQIPLLWPTEFTRDTVTLSYDLTWGDGSSLKASLYSNTSELYRDESGWSMSPNPRFQAYAGQVTGEAKNSGLNVLAETLVSNLIGNEEHTFTYGIDYLKHDTQYDLAIAAGGTKHSEETAKNLALFVQDKIDFGNGFALIPGVRHDSYDINAVTVDNDFSEFSFSLAAQYQVNNNLMVKLSSTELFKGPEISEVFVGAGLGEKLNSGIEAETGLNNELSVAFENALSTDKVLRLGATVFNTQIDDYIFDSAALPGGGPRETWKDNVGDMTVKGFETYAGFSVDAFSFQISYSKSESDLDAFAQYSSLQGARLEREQGDTIAADFTYQLSAYNLTLNWDFMAVGDVAKGTDLYGADLDNSKDGFTVHNISAHWQPEAVANLHVRVGIDNLFDEFYSSQSSKNGVSFHPVFGKLFLMDYEPGRNIKASISYQF
ncbi:TonB-dependent receptor domain-containing protein [Pseudoalteromonas sp. S16_S37]|uniref:TonB-dependent receptor domain-containing protein n=1 Tax=Pseudoalteromonas sp. S16_S37 TaxID=2720228 RepID=UPI001681C214|nr:TonB-dependent receptor [Pseudoalteromonas sp. S16_S37]MBD1583970.1 TonB-dependent receptor [Pseudoalteromonas sp. S16_S37]